jgi:predicted MPP superfamily phosphohydrolase
VCVLTGDYRGATFGPFDAALDGLARVRSHLKDPVYGVLGNHDTIRMVPGLEEMGIRMLLNECERILRGDQAIYLAGIDDAHYHRVDNIEKAASEIPDNGFSILLSHTPEIYRQAAHGGFDLFVSGHTHGGQICLPGSIPITLDSVLPRHMGSGPWKHRDTVGYTSVGVGTSVVPVRINCLPENAASPPMLGMSKVDPRGPSTTGACNAAGGSGWRRGRAAPDRCTSRAIAHHPPDRCQSHVAN